MDDIVIRGRDSGEHDRNVDNFLNRAREKNLKISSEKSVFGGTKLCFLGHVITDGTIAPDPEHSAPFVNFLTPRTPKQLERFIGLTVYHSKWISNFSRIMAPLFSVLHDKKFPLDESAMNAILQVKNAIKDAILHIVDPQKELTITTDSSQHAIGGILLQDGWPVAFMSQRLSKTQ